jgi:copper chaperone CopZ
MYVVDLKTDRATVTYDPTQATQELIVKAVAEAGYRTRQVMEVK